MSNDRWFVVPASQWRDAHVVLPDSEAHHAATVLRVRPGDVVTLTDGRGRVARCSIERGDRGRIVAEILDQEQASRPLPELVLYQAVAKGKKLDAVVADVAELGAGRFFVYESARAVARWEPAKLERLLDRWRAMTDAAAKQTRTPFVMEIGGALRWRDLVERVSRESHAIVLWEEASLRLRKALPENAERVALVVGPEGGLAREEAQELARAGAVLTSLGPRILRTEMAPVVAVGIVLSHYGRIG